MPHQHTTTQPHINTSKREYNSNNQNNQPTNRNSRPRAIEFIRECFDLTDHFQLDVLNISLLLCSIQLQENSVQKLLPLPRTSESYTGKKCIRRGNVKIKNGIYSRLCVLGQGPERLGRADVEAYLVKRLTHTNTHTYTITHHYTNSCQGRFSCPAHHEYMRSRSSSSSWPLRRLSIFLTLLTFSWSTRNV